ncbi:MAG: hypothetical protein AB7U98_06025 [Candidatus Nitrosocosmicus sp.]
MLSGVLLISVYILIPSKNNDSHTNLYQYQSQNILIGHWSKLHSLLDKRQWREAIIIGSALILGGQGVLTWCEQYLSSSVTALLFRLLLYAYYLLER